MGPPITPPLTNTPVLSANKAPRNAAAFDLFAGVDRAVGGIIRFGLGGTLLQGAVKGLDLSCPELECASMIATVAAEGNLRGSSGEHVYDFSVCGQ